MADVTATVNELLTKRQAPAIYCVSYSSDHINEFLKDAYQIVTSAEGCRNYIISNKVYSTHA